MKEAVIVRVGGQIGLTQEVVRTVIAASIHDAIAEAEADIAGEADAHGKWYLINKAEVIGPCFVTAKVLEAPPRSAAVPASSTDPRVLGAESLFRDLLAAVVGEEAGNDVNLFMYIWTKKWEPLRARIEAYLAQAASEGSSHG